MSLASDLLTFSRGGRLLLTSASGMRPVLVRTGVGAVEDLLRRVRSGADTETLLSHGHPESLLITLRNHRILRDDGREGERPAGRPRTVATPQARPLARGISLYLLLSQGCNLGCVYCLNGDETYRRRTAPRMSREVAFRAIDRCMERLKEGGQLQIVFFGGEPLLNWPLAEEIVDYVESEVPRNHPGKRWHFHLTSNLAALPRGLIDTLKDHRITVLCDVDGPPELHDSTRPFRGGRPSCARITTNVGRLVDAGIPVALRATITSRNVERMSDVACYHKAIGGSGTSAVPVNAVNSDEDFLAEDLLPDPDTFARGLRETLHAGFDIGHVFPFNQFARTLRTDLHQTIGCGAALGNTPVVDVGGDVYACIYLVGMERFRTGNVLSDAGFPDWEVLDRMAHQVRVDHIEGCKDCLYREVCVGGCAVGTLLVADNPRAGPRIREYQREVRCKSMPVIVEETLWHMAGQADKALMRVEPGGNGSAHETGGVRFCDD